MLHLNIFISYTIICFSFFIKVKVNLKKLEIIVSDKELSTSEPLDCWENKQMNYFTEEYSWLFLNYKKLGHKI